MKLTREEIVDGIYLIGIGCFLGMAIAAIEAIAVAMYL